jgi:hypothetical protein
MMKALPWRMGALALAPGLVACAAAYAPRSLTPGATLAQAIAVMGPPTARYARPDGERLEYARGPYGKHTYMLDFDTRGRLLRWQQVLTEDQFNAVRAGQSREDVLFAIGHPSEARGLPRQQHLLWSYRYESPFCSWFQVSIDRRGLVAETGYGPDPACEINIEGDAR